MDEGNPTRVEVRRVDQTKQKGPADGGAGRRPVRVRFSLRGLQATVWGLVIMVFVGAFMALVLCFGVVVAVLTLPARMFRRR